MPGPFHRQILPGASGYEDEGNPVLAERGRDGEDEVATDTDVQERQCGQFRRYHRHGGGEVIGDLDVAEAEIAQHLLDMHGDDRIVLDDEDPGWSLRGLPPLGR